MMNKPFFNKKPFILFVAGFGDNSSMYEKLLETKLVDKYELGLVDFPGFGIEKALRDTTTLGSLAEFIDRKAIENNAEIIVAHSVASIIASLSATHEKSPINTLISLEGNLTFADAYFTGCAAKFKSHQEFLIAFCKRLELMSIGNPMLTRYRKQILKCDPIALWELGCDAHLFSHKFHPGELLQQVKNVFYLYNPNNCAKESIEWLQKSTINSTILKETSHWPSLDQPALLAETIVEILGD